MEVGIARENGPVVTKSRPVAPTALNGSFIESHVKGDTVAAPAPDIVEDVFLVKVAARDREEVGPVPIAKHHKDAEEFWRTRRGHLLRR